MFTMTDDGVQTRSRRFNTKRFFSFAISFTISLSIYALIREVIGWTAYGSLSDYWLGVIITAAVYEFILPRNALP